MELLVILGLTGFRTSSFGNSDGVSAVVLSAIVRLCSLAKSWIRRLLGSIMFEHGIHTWGGEDVDHCEGAQG
jgi:hypothetical protein